MFDRFIERIQRQAIKAYPNEAVWVITRKGCRQVANVHEEPTEHFALSAEDHLAAYRDGLKAVVHSHPDQPLYPSKQDMEGQARSNVPWAIVQTNGETASKPLWWGLSDPAPLEGRIFIHGVSDCFTLLRDYYRLNHGHDIGEFPRDWHSWWKEDQYAVNMPLRGFEAVPRAKAQPGDALVFHIRGPHPHHCAVLLDGGLMLHQPGAMKPIDPDKVSRKEVLAPYLPYLSQVYRPAFLDRHKED